MEQTQQDLFQLAFPDVVLQIQGWIQPAHQPGDFRIRSAKTLLFKIILLAGNGISRCLVGDRGVPVPVEGATKTRTKIQ
jgi:hypothetical protein